MSKCKFKDWKPNPKVAMRGWQVMFLVKNGFQAKEIRKELSLPSVSLVYEARRRYNVSPKYRRAVRAIGAL